MTAQTYHHYQVEGLDIDIPVFIDEKSGREIEHYPDFAEHPAYTAAGHRLTLALEDACPLALPAGEDACTDCALCRFYRPAGEKTLFGVCVVQNDACADGAKDAASH